MRSLLVFFLLFSLCLCKRIEKKDVKISFIELGYCKPNLFVFTVSQTDSNKITISRDTLGLFCSGFIFNKEYHSTSTHWEFLRIDSNNKYKMIGVGHDRSSEGTFASDSELFIHPARDCFRILQFCPYPYFKNNLDIGDRWTWTFKVGSGWAIDSIFPIEEHNPIEISTKYYVQDTTTIKTKFGNLYCSHIVATSTSEYGTSYGSYYINNKYGLVNFKLQTVNGLLFEFEVIDKIGM